jgi:transcriptional antiterminator NusG
MGEEQVKTNLQDKVWYIATTYSTHENKVAENIRRRIETMNLQDQIFRVLVAEEVIENKDDPKKNKVSNLYPGYIFVEMIMTDESWYMVRNTPGVTGIIGSSGGGTKPTPVPASEMESVLKRIGQIDASMLSRYQNGDEVNIINGPFSGSHGKIINIDGETNKITLMISFFGRETPLDVEFKDIEKIS